MTIDMTCKRCYVGIDNDGDGDCNVCARMSESAVVALRFRFQIALERAVDVARISAFEEMNTVLRTTSKTNPVIALLDYRQKYPKHGDLHREMEVTINKQMQALGHPVFTNVGAAVDTIG